MTAPTINQALIAIAKSKRSKKLLVNKWCCPCCGRSCYQIVRQNKSKPGSWIFEAIMHHDHSELALSQPPRFQKIIICGDCNKIDGIVKCENYQLRYDFWSFSIDEIRSVITAKPHSMHKINMPKAVKIAADLIHEVCRAQIAKEEGLNV